MSRIKDEVYVPVSPDERRRIIERINCNQLSSGRARGRNRDIFHWTNILKNQYLRICIWNFIRTIFTLY